jgi:hypothetical protein
MSDIVVIKIIFCIGLYGKKMIKIENFDSNIDYDSMFSENFTFDLDDPYIVPKEWGIYSGELLYNESSFNELKLTSVNLLYKL